MLAVKRPWMWAFYSMFFQLVFYPKIVIIVELNILNQYRNNMELQVIIVKNSYIGSTLEKFTANMQ